MFCTLHVARCTEFTRQIRRGGGKGKGRGGGKNSRVGEEARIKKHPTFKGYAQSVGSTCEQLLRCGAGARRWLLGNKLRLLWPYISNCCTYSNQRAFDEAVASVQL